MKCPDCQADNAATAATCASCGATLKNVYAAPTAHYEPAVELRPVPAPGGDDDAVATIIPYKNPAALISYYLGLFSCLPILGFPMAIVALVLAFKGFKARRLNPRTHGIAHAWVGLICGAIGFLINGLIIVAIVLGIVASFMKPNR